MRPIESSAGRTQQQPGGYLAFIPNPMPRDQIPFEESTWTAIEAAAGAIGELKGIASSLPNPDLFLAMYVRKESLISSEIEGVVSTLSDVLAFEGSPAGASRDTALVVHYVAALNAGIARVRAGEQISLALIQDLHGILLQDKRPKEGDDPPGRFRTKQNAVGREMDTLQTAQFVPPPSGAVGEMTPMFTSLVNLAYYINEFDGHRPLVRCAMAHAQFETIHPFGDGNGRVGRMLIPLMLARDGLLNSPLLYPSLALKNDKPNYYDRLMAVRARGDWDGWVRFFMEAMAAAAQDSIALIKHITELQSEVVAAARKLTPTARKVAEHLFQQPVLTVPAVKAHFDVVFTTAADAMRALEKIGVVEEIKGGSRNKTYRFTRYVELLEGAGEVPRING